MTSLVRLSAALPLALAALLAAAPAASATSVSEYQQVPVGACAGAPVDTPGGASVWVGDITVTVPSVGSPEACAGTTVTAYADAHALPRAYTACVYGPAAYGEGAGVETSGTGGGVTYTVDGEPQSAPVEGAPDAGAATGYFEYGELQSSCP